MDFNMRHSVQNDAVLRQRLLNDIAELQRKPYPGIELHVQDNTALERACLVLRPDGEAPLHLTIKFGTRYPLTAPEITMQSQVDHPNIFNSYICASILNTEEGYTPAYTLKGICIQMLSFFSSETIEQQHGGPAINRKAYARESIRYNVHLVDDYACTLCGFGLATTGHKVQNVPDTTDVAMPDAEEQALLTTTPITTLPVEALLLICDFLEDEDLMHASWAWNQFGRVMRRYNVVRTRDLCCFVTKKGFKNRVLGVGVHVQGKSIQSDFDVVSAEAFFELKVRRSVQGLTFEHWMPLPLSEMHWKRVRDGLDQDLMGISRAANIQGALINVIYTFMNDVVVRLSQSVDDLGQQHQQRSRFGGLEQAKSTLTHASEKAIESYFHLYHLLLCMACERSSLVNDVNILIKRFVAGERDKKTCPNLGHLLVMLLISDVGVVDKNGGAIVDDDAMPSVEDTVKAIVKEAVTRNVVWMLDSRGANMPELCYMEESAISDYRLQKTFEASKTSYRLLMFLNLMRQTVAPVGTRRTLHERRDDLFSRHGGPPYGAAAGLAAAIRKIQQINSFPEFLHAMSITEPMSKSRFTSFLRNTVHDSMDKGYSKWALRQQEALYLRLQREPSVEVQDGIRPLPLIGNYSFFPQDQRRGGGAVIGGARGGSGLGAGLATGRGVGRGAGRRAGGWHG